QFLGSLAGVEALAQRSGKNLVVIFDAVNDYRGPEKDGTQTLLRRIDSLVSRLPAEQIRVVVSSTTAVWSRLDRGATMRAQSDRYHRALNDDPFVGLGVFTAEELASAY